MGHVDPNLLKQNIDTMVKHENVCLILCSLLSHERFANASDAQGFANRLEPFVGFVVYFLGPGSLLYKHASFLSIYIYIYIQYIYIYIFPKQRLH